MKNTLTKKTNASYVINVEVEAKDRDALHQKTLKSLQKEVKVQGFRQGHVPLHLVEKQVQPEYVRMAFLEEAMHDAINAVIKEHADIQFIGQAYELNTEEKDGKTIITFTLDTYPEVEIQNTDWKKLTINSIDTSVTDDEVEAALSNLQKQYAEYKDTDSISLTTLVKASYSMVDKDGKELHKGSAFTGKEEYEESALLWKAYEGKKKGDIVEIDYKEDKLPHAVHYHPHGSELAKQIKKVILTIVDTKETLLPDLNDAAVLTKLFQTPDITNRDALVEKVRSVLAEQKEEQGLQQAVEAMLVEARSSLNVTIPETIIREEMGARIKSIGDRMGGENGLKQYFEQIGQEKTNEMYDEIKKSAQDSLEKFFILRKLTELLEITDINWNNAMDAEKKIYAALQNGLTQSSAKKPSAKKATKKDAVEESGDVETTEKSEKPARKPRAKKTTDEASA